MELIVVIAIIGVLAAVLIPTFSGAIDSARQASDKSDVTHMNQELMIYKIQENVSSVDYHSALLWLTTNGYSLESSAKGYAYWFDEDAEQLVYAQVDEAISAASANTDGTFYDDPGKIAANKDLTLIDRRTDNPIITAVNGIRNLVQEASSKTTFTEIVAEMGTMYDEYIATVNDTRVTEYLKHFDPDTTLYITESGVYSGAYERTSTGSTGEGTEGTTETTPATTASAVVFSDTLRVIDKGLGNPEYRIKSMAIELPHTVAVVMDGALSSIVPASGATVTIAGEKAQFIEGSINTTVASASSIQTIKLNDLSVSGGSIDYTVQYAYKEAVIQLANGARRTFREELVDLQNKEKPLTMEQAIEKGTLLTGQVSAYITDEEEAAGAVILREYLVPTFTFTGSFANVSGISIQMKKDGDLVVFYGITYGKNGTISQVVTFGYWTDITEGARDIRNDTNDETIAYQYTVSDPLRGYAFDGRYEGLVVTAYYTSEGKEESIALTQSDSDTVYRSTDNVANAPSTKAVKYTTTLNGLLLYAEYVQTTETGSSAGTSGQETPSAEAA